LVAQANTIQRSLQRISQDLCPVSAFIKKMESNSL
jgi:hypothetical protein